MQYTPNNPLDPKERFRADLPPEANSTASSCPSSEGIVITECGFGLIYVNGEDADEFLQSQLTCDISALTLNQSTYSGWCNPKGRLLTTFMVLRSPLGFILLLPSNNIDPVTSRLKMYILRAKVSVEKAPQTIEVVELCGGQLIHNIKLLVDTLDSKCGITLHNYPNNQERALIIGEAESLKTLRAELDQPVLAADENHHHWLNIRHGIPEISITTSELFVPQEVNLDLLDGVSFTKGCYPGQEIVARMRYRGKLKRRMFSGHIDISSLQPEDYPSAGDTLRATDGDQQKVGTLVATACTLNKGMDVLAVLPAQSEPGSRFSLSNRENQMITLHTLPYSIGQES
jgi:hypothetical protein